MAKDERFIVVADMNDQVDKTGDGYKDVLGGHGYGETYLEGVRLLETEQGLNVFIVNTGFEKGDEHLKKKVEVW